MIKILEDSHGRSFPYLRLSLTDVCNFSCSYCLPNGYQKTGLENHNLNVDEIRRLVTAFANMGTWKVRLTGGEPTIRKDFVEIAKTVSNIQGIEKLAVTTNGYKLPEKAQSFYDAGIRAINISMDSLDPEKFHKITGHNRLQEVMDGIDKCLELGFDKVKINAVLMDGINNIELDNFLLYTKLKNVDVRFIELMSTGDNQEFFYKHHVKSEDLINTLTSKGWIEKIREQGAGPAIEYVHSSHQGKIGIISPYSKDFCKSCNRLRVSCRGELQLCLFGTGRESLRHLLQNDSQIEELQQTIQNQLDYKKSSHFLHNGDFGITNNLASIGG